MTPPDMTRRGKWCGDDDERRRQQFEKRAPMLQKTEFPKLKCTRCFMEVTARCNCGVSYVSPAELAKRAVKANPEKSNRAIAAETGVGLGTVNRARKATEPNGSVEKRVGRDGKRRQQPTKHRAASDELASRSEIEPTTTEAAENVDIDALWSGHESSVDDLLRAGVSGAEILMRDMLQVGLLKDVKTEDDLRIVLKQLALAYLGLQHA
jgi:hypothetical protein